VAPEIGYYNMTCVELALRIFNIIPGGIYYVLFVQTMICHAHSMSLIRLCEFIGTNYKLY